MSNTVEAANFQSPKRKRKVPATASKRYSAVSRKISESPYKLFDANRDVPSLNGQTGGEDADASNAYYSALESPDRSTAHRHYSVATDSEGNSTKVVHSPPLSGSPNHLASTFPRNVAESPFQYADFSANGPRRVAMETCQDSSLSSISHNNSALLNSPPRYLFDSNGTGVDVDLEDGEDFAVDNFNSTIADHTTAMSPSVDLNVHSFDDVQSPEVGSISMCASPLHGLLRERDTARHSPSKRLIALSPTILRSTPSPRTAHHFSCVRQMSFGEEGHFSRSGNASPLQFNSFIAPQVSSPAPQTRQALVRNPATLPRRQMPAVAEETWHGDSSGVAKDMSTLNVNKHHHDYDSNSDDSKVKHKFRRGLAGGPILSGGARESEVGPSGSFENNEVYDRNGPSPIMSNHTSFMDLLDAASESPTPKAPANSRSDGINMPSAPPRVVQPTFKMGSQTRASDSPYHAAGPGGTPQRPNRGSRTAGLKKQFAIDFDSPCSSLDKSPCPPVGMDAPAPPSEQNSAYSSPAASKLGKRLDLSPPGSFVSVASGNTSCTEDDELPSPPRKHGSSRSILSDFGINYGLDKELQRTNSNNSMQSTASSLPLPDQSAFDHSVVKPRRSGGARGAPSPVCPPTPDRSNIHWGTVYANNSVGSIDTGANDSGNYGDASDEDDNFAMGGHHCFGSLSQAYPLLRQNSLDSNKVLVEGEVSRDPSDTPDVVFDRDFENLGVLGAGSFAVVYFSKRKRKTGGADEPEKVFAVKKNKKKFRGHGDRESLLNEVRMMKLAGTTSCPHIVHLIRAWQEEGFFYVQMDIAERGSLRDLVLNMTDNNMAFPDSTVWRLIHDTLLGLRHIHSYDVVHLDIKPANLLISRTGRVMIGDFGLAAHAHDDKDGNEGDARYMAPEVLNFTERSSASDMFSFGLTFYEICVVPTPRCNLPVQGDLWTAMREGKVPPVETEYEPRTKALNELLMACLAQSPEQRATAAELLTLPEVVRVAELFKAENEECLDPILSAIPAAVAVPARMSRSKSFLAPPPQMTRPESFRLAFEGGTLPRIDVSQCDQDRSQQTATPTADLMTPTHADSNLILPHGAALFRFKKGVPK